MVKNFLIVLKKSTTDAIKTTAEATGDLIGNKIADKITSILNKKSSNNDDAEENVEITTHKKRYVSPEERQQIIDELRLVPKNYWCLFNSICLKNTNCFAMYKNGIPKNSELVRQCIKSTI